MTLLFSSQDKKTKIRKDLIQSWDALFDPLKIGGKTSVQVKLRTQIEWEPLQRRSNKCKIL